MHNLLVGLAGLGNVRVIIALIVGSCFGLVLGSFPGLGPASVLIVALPLTYRFSAVIALTFMGAAYTSAVYGGAITAILYRVPGHPGNIATVFDGYPLAQSGQAALALAATAAAGCVGGLLATVFVFGLGPLVSRLAVLVTPADYFLLAIFGLTMVALTSKGNQIQGLLLGALGLAVSTIGQDPLDGSYRLFFGSEFLKNNGIPLGILAIGIFAIGSAFFMVQTRIGVVSQAVDSKQSVLGNHRFRSLGQGLAAVKEHPFSILRSAIVGIVTGIIPGLGIVVSNVLAYRVEQKFNPSARWGTGYIVGVMAPETADNATLVAELVPAFSLGIPGAVTSAIMLSALAVHGIQASPDFYINMTSTVSEIFAAIGVSQIVFALLGFVFAPAIARLAQVSPKLLGPAILIAGFTGVFASRGLFGDEVVALVAGVVGLMIFNLRLPLAPLLIGVVLGPLAEENFVRARLVASTSHTSFFHGPATVALACLVGLAVCAIAILVFREIVGTIWVRNTNVPLEDEFLERISEEEQP